MPGYYAGAVKRRGRYRIRHEGAGLLFPNGKPVVSQHNIAPRHAHVVVKLGAVARGKAQDKRLS